MAWCCVTAGAVVMLCGGACGAVVVHYSPSPELERGLARCH